MLMKTKEIQLGVLAVAGTRSILMLFIDQVFFISNSANSPY